MVGGGGPEKIPFPVSQLDKISSYIDMFSIKVCLNKKVIIISYVTKSANWTVPNIKYKSSILTILSNTEQRSTHLNILYSTDVKF